MAETVDLQATDERVFVLSLARPFGDSGPFILKRERRLPGERAPFRRNPRYVLRDEPADGLAGSKVAKVSGWR